MSSDTLTKYAARPLTAFAIGAAGTHVFAPGVAGLALEIKGVQIPVWVFGGLASAVGVALGQVTNDYVAPHITSLTLLSAPVHSALNIGIGASSTALAYHLAAGSAWSDSVGLTSVLAISAASEIGSGYLTESWWRPMIEQYMR
jgi:hypothetical protein